MTAHPRIARDQADPAAADAALGALPEWRLDDLYAAPDDPALRRDLDWARAAVADFAARCEGKLATFDGDALAGVIADYEQIQLRLGRVMSYASLRYQQNTADAARAKFLGDMQGEVTDLTTPLVFFTLELNRIDDGALAAHLAQSPALAHWRPWIERVRAFRPHQLSDELERFEHDRSVVGVSSWVRLYDETTAALTFDVAG